MGGIIATNRQEGGGEQGQSHQSHQSQDRSRPKILSRDECLEKLSALPGLVAMGLLTTSKANCIRGTISTVLQFNSKETSSDSRREVDPTELAAMLKANPEMDKFLEPFLSRDQIEALLNVGLGDVGS